MDVEIYLAINVRVNLMSRSPVKLSLNWPQKLKKVGTAGSSRGFRFIIKPVTPPGDEYTSGLNSLSLRTSSWLWQHKKSPRMYVHITFILLILLPWEARGAFYAGISSHPSVQKATTVSRRWKWKGATLKWGVMFEGAACVAPPHLYKIIKLSCSQ